MNKNQTAYSITIIIYLFGASRFANSLAKITVKDFLLSTNAEAQKIALLKKAVSSTLGTHIVLTIENFKKVA